MAAPREICLQPLLVHREAELLEPLDRPLREVFVGDVCERLAAPETERLPETVGRELGIALCERIRSLLGECLELVQIETASRDPEDVSR